MADALSDWDFPSYRHYKVDFVDLEAKTSPLLVEKVRKSLKVIQDAYCKYLFVFPSAKQHNLYR
jgi:hypothetical protein